VLQKALHNIGNVSLSTEMASK